MTSPTELFCEARFNETKTETIGSANINLETHNEEAISNKIDLPNQKAMMIIMSINSLILSRIFINNNFSLGENLIANAFFGIFIAIGLNSSSKKR